MKALRDLVVGDTVVITDTNARGRPPARVAVTKVARVYLTAGEGWRSEKFDRITGCQPPGDRYRHLHAYSEDEFAGLERVTSAQRALAAAGIDFRIGARWPDADVLALAEFVAKLRGGAA